MSNRASTAPLLFGMAHFRGADIGDPLANVSSCASVCGINGLESFFTGVSYCGMRAIDPSRRPPARARAFLRPAEGQSEAARYSARGSCTCPTPACGTSAVRNGSPGRGPFPAEELRIPASSLMNEAICPISSLCH